MLVQLRMLYPVLILIAWRFNIHRKSLTILSGSDNRSLNNIKWTMHTAWIFREQAKVKEQWSREMSLAQTYNSIEDIEGYDLLWYKDNKQALHSSSIKTNNSTVLVSWRLASSGTDKNRKDHQEYYDMTWPGLTNDFEYWLFMFYLSSISNDKERVSTQEICFSHTK
jgi:hypothetical protein